MCFGGAQRVGPRFGELPRVAVNQALAPDLDVLRSIPSGTVQSVRFLTEQEATVRYGPEMVNGVIEVTLGSAPR